jgi:hypothetical protein
VLKEKLGGQLYSMDDDENDTSPDIQIDDFATSADATDQEER